MLAQYSDHELVSLCTEFISALDGTQLVGEAKLRINGATAVRRIGVGNEIQISWDCSKLGSRLTSPLHYDDQDGKRVDVKISINKDFEVIEVEFWKYALEPIYEFPKVEKLTLQGKF